MKIVGCLPRNACFDAPTCLVSSLWFSCGLAVAMGEAANLSCFKVSKQVVARFCVAGVPLRDILTCLQTSESRFVWQVQYLCDVFRRCVPLLVAGATLETSIVILRGRRSTSDVSRCGVAYFLRIPMSGMSCVKW